MAKKNQRSKAKNKDSYSGKYTAANSRRGKNAKKQRSTVIGVCVTVIVLGIALLSGCLFLFGREDGTIYAGVRVAGVEVGGMTKKEAESAVKDATKNTYTQKNMVVKVLDSSVEIPAAYAGELDVAKAVDTAYDYGRKGTPKDREEQIQKAAEHGYDVDISSCLPLQEGHIKECLNELGKQYSSTLVQSTFEVTGKKPTKDDIQTGKNLQTLVVKLGTPEYGLNMDLLYKTVLESYSKNVFTTIGQCGSVDPDPIDLQAILDEYYVAPVNAQLKSNSSDIEEGKYGYGFSVTEAKKKLDAAKPGSTVKIPFVQLMPEITAENLMQTTFKDVLATYTAVSDNDNADRNTNLRLACEAIDGIILSPGEYFSYNAALGERTAARGYKPGPSYAGGKTIYTIGGGICQVSSALYYCAMVADLKIEERYEHAFFPGYVPLGMDATVSWGSLDFCFRNNSSHHILIDASAVGPEITVSLMGIDDKDYYVEMEYEVLKEYPSTTHYQTMEADNKDGYKNGDYIVTPYKGYDINTYRCKYNKETKALISKVKEAFSDYKKRDGIICEIPDTSPTDPTGGIGGSGGDISDSGELPDE